MIAWFVASHLISRFVGGGVLRLFAGNLMGDLKKLWGWLCHRSFWQLAFGAALLLAGFEYIGKRTEQRHAHKVEAQLSKAVAGREADRATYTKAQSDAAVQNKAHVATENKLREQISENSHSNFVSQRDRLRSQSGAAQGASGTAGVPQVPHAAAGTPPEAMSLPPSELLRAQETELELNALIDWVIAQSKIDPNAEPKP